MLAIGDCILGLDGIKIVSDIIDNAQQNTDAYDLEVEDCHTFIANNVVVHNSKIAMSMIE